MAFKFAPLNTTFLLVSILGFFFSIIYVPKISITWAFALGVLFVIMFIAVMVTISKQK